METRFNHTLPLLLHIATAITGLIDAISYLALGHVFTANMTGNVGVAVGYRDTLVELLCRNINETADNDYSRK